MRSRPARAALVFAAVGAAMLADPAPLRPSEPYEAEGPVRAADYLAAELLRGDEWRVAEEARNDGLDNTYTVESRFGSWTARGEEQVAARIVEIGALSTLEEVSKTEVFLDAVKTSAVAPLRLVQEVAERPKETLEGLPSGVGRWFRRTSFKLRETYHDVSERVEEERAERRERKAAAAAGGGEASGAAGDDGDRSAEKRAELREELETRARKEGRDYLRISRAQRRWYRELGVDPYTDNELLRDAVESVARVEGLTSFGMKVLTLPALPASGAMRRSLDLVWATHSGDLRLANRKRMLAGGLSKRTARAFENSPLTLTEQTAFLDAIDELAGVAGRERLFGLAAEVAGRDEARTITVTVGLLADLHRGATPLEAILPGSAPAVARTRDGDLVAVLPAGAVFYTRAVAEGLREFAAAHDGHASARRRLVVTGLTSSRFEEGSRELGWEVSKKWRP